MESHGQQDSTDIDVDAMRAATIRLHRLSGLDEIRTFYYDETNNIRKLHVTERGLNVAEPGVFVLGGIVHPGPPKQLDLENLLRALRIQPNVSDLKVEHIAKGTFLEMLGSSKLTGFLEWIEDRDYAIHYSALDPLYWASVDIIDSVLSEGAAPLIAIAPQLKNDLYRLLRPDLRGTAALFLKFSYPAILAADRAGFMEALLDLLEGRWETMDHFNAMMLKGVLQMGTKAVDLPFLDETPNVLISEFVSFFIHRICLFPTSTHIFDEEKVVQQALARYRFVSGGRALNNFHFSRSHDEQGIQLSDVVAGLLGKCFSWITRNHLDEVAAIRGELSAAQEINRILLARIIERSIAVTPAFSHHVLSLDDRRSVDFFFEV